MSTKTSIKRIALVAVSALGFGLLSTVPAKAATVAANISFSVKPTGITATADIDVAAAATSDTAVTRAGATISVYKVASTDADWAAAAAGDAGRFRLKLGTTLGSWVDYVDGTTTATITVPAGVTSGDLEVEIDLNTTDGGSIVSSADVSLTIINAGAPRSVSWAATSVTEIAASATDYALNATPKDANGVSTILLDGEKIVLTTTPETGVAASQVDTSDGNGLELTEAEADTVTPVHTNYLATLDGNGTNTGSTVSGTEYTITAQLQDSTTAIGAPAATKYKRLSSTSALTGSLVFRTAAASTYAERTSLSAVYTAGGVASSGFNIRALDANGGRIKNATVVLSVSGITGTFANNNQATLQTGQVTNDYTFTPTSAGSGTITATITTGTTSITKTMSVTAAGYGTTPTVAPTVSAVNEDGAQFAADAATAAVDYYAGLTTTEVTITISGVDASKALDVALDGTTNVAGGALSATRLIANASGVATVSLTTTGATTGQFALVNVDAAGDAGAADATVKVTWRNNTPDLSSTPTNSTTLFVSPSSTTNVSASVADVFGNAYTAGAVVTLANTSAPAGVTLQDNVVKTATGGSATLGAVVGATAGNYVFTVSGTDANGSALSTTNTITLTVTTSGGPGSLKVTTGSNTSTTSFRVWTSNNGVTPIYDGSDGGDAADNEIADAYTTATATAAQIKTATGDASKIEVEVKNDAGLAVENVSVSVSSKSAGVYVRASVPTSGTTKLSAFTATSDKTNSSGIAEFWVVATVPGTNTVTFSVGSSTVTATFLSAVAPDTAYARNIALDKSTATQTAGQVTQLTATVTDAFGNAVSGVTLSGAATGLAGRFAGGSRSASVTTDSTGKAVFEVTSETTESGTGTITITGTEGTGDIAKFLAGDLSGNLSTLGTATVKSGTMALTVTASTAKTNDQVFAEATAAGTKADEAKAEAALATAAATTAGTKADAAKDAAAAAETAAAKAGTDAVAAAKAAETASVAAADAAKAEAAKATAAATANAVEIAKLMAAITALTTSVSTGNSSASDAYEAAAEAIDAANAATDAANIAAEAADAATVAAEEARDAADAATAAVEELATQVSTLIASLKAQITTLGNTVAKIAKKVRA